MRKIAFGYSTRCNIRCSHCVAAGENPVTSILYNCIRTMGVTTIASFAGMKSRDIVTYRKCDLCRKMFNDPETLPALQKAAPGSLLKWHR
jgi:hypothetical protein